MTSSAKALAVALLAVAIAAGASAQAEEGKAKKVRVTLRNECHFRIWPGVYPGHDVATSTNVLLPRQSAWLHIHPWAYDTYIWARTQCAFPHGQDAEPLCVTGNCGSGYHFRCFYGALPSDSPAVSTVFFRNNKFSVDLSSGFNIPVSVAANAVGAGAVNVTGVASTCQRAAVMGCAKDVNALCPLHMRVFRRDRVVACSPLKQKRDMEDYFQILSRMCPCTHPHSAPPRTTDPSIAQGYTVTFCPSSLGPA